MAWQLLDSKTTPKTMHLLVKAEDRSLHVSASVVTRWQRGKQTKGAYNHAVP
jgi:hypothetical protein